MPTTQQTAILHSGYESGSRLAETMRSIQSLFDRYEDGSLVPTRALTNDAQRKKSKPVDPEQMAYLYDKAKTEGRSLSDVGLEAEITVNNLYRWARANGLPTNKEDLRKGLSE